MAFQPRDTVSIEGPKCVYAHTTGEEWARGARTEQVSVEERVMGMASCITCSLLCPKTTSVIGESFSCAKGKPLTMVLIILVTWLLEAEAGPLESKAMLIHREGSEMKGRGEKVWEVVVWGRRNYGRGATEKKNSGTGISKLHSFVLVLFCHLLNLRDFRTISIFVCLFLNCLLYLHYEALSLAVCLLLLHCAHLTGMQDS